MMVSVRPRGVEPAGTPRVAETSISIGLQKTLRVTTLIRSRKETWGRGNYSDKP